MAVMHPYLTIRERVETRIEIKRSIFLCQLFPVQTEDELRECVEETKKQYWNARHHCTAAIIGVGSTQRERSSDDGEPAGTAGAPMLDVLKGKEISDILAITTRWFGGTLLGASGLIHAYADSVKTSLEAAAQGNSLVYRTPKLLFETVLSHQQAGKIEAEFRNRDWVHEVEYHDRVKITLALSEKESDAAQQLLAELSLGEGSLKQNGHFWVDVPLQKST